MDENLKKESSSEIYKIYYGDCKLYLVPYIPKDAHEPVCYFLKIFDYQRGYLLFTLKISAYIMENYLKKILSEIPCGNVAYRECQKLAARKKIAFVSQLDVKENGKYINVEGSLRDSRMLFIE
ncbi:hypothetical protein [Streptococcus sp. DD11]|uniref:hypothetical protein n=1 Tax=Streptococcus sp. DD11 TaxID=1777879 RepID=UPI000B024CA0|nr:hypothetical protein [Streptococcus sp. DD11]